MLLPLPPTLLHGYKFPLFLVVFGVEPKPLPQNPIAVVPTAIMMVLCKASLLFFVKGCE